VMAPPAPARKMLEPKLEPLPPPLTPLLGVTVLRLTVSEPRKRQAATRLPEDRATHTGTSVTAAPMPPPKLSHPPAPLPPDVAPVAIPNEPLYPPAFPPLA
jgi:hypothetical protein